VPGIVALRVLYPEKLHKQSGAAATKGRLKTRFVAVRVRIADGPQQRIKDRGQQHLPGEEARLIGEHRNSGRSMKTGGAAAETNSIVNPREENCTASVRVTSTGVRLEGALRPVVGDEPDSCRVSVGTFPNHNMLRAPAFARGHSGRGKF